MSFIDKLLNRHKIPPPEVNAIVEPLKELEGKDLKEAEDVVRLKKEADRRIEAGFTNRKTIIEINSVDRLRQIREVLEKSLKETLSIDDYLDETREDARSRRGYRWTDSDNYTYTVFETDSFGFRTSRSRGVEITVANEDMMKKWEQLPGDFALLRIFSSVYVENNITREENEHLDEILKILEAVEGKIQGAIALRGKEAFAGTIFEELIETRFTKHEI
uniref:Uncharacterized protein n=1 Tax=Ochrobactrum phage ORM_20 TaxID=2985243 RepID=A0A9N6ZGH4_9VIRU|nr:hypothetical protein ORM20_00148 [Ochrobactrum phage ORM_20]